MKFRWILLMLVVAPFLNGCIPDPVDIEIPQAESKLVVASQMLLDRFLLVQVSRSFGALEFSQTAGDTLSDDLLSRLLVDSGRVVLISQGQSDTLLSLGNGLYLSLETQLIPGERYQLSVFDSLSGMQVFAESEVLPVAPIGSVGYEWRVTPLPFDSTFRDSSLAVFLEFDDLPGESYYMVNLYRLAQADSQGVANIFGNLLGSQAQNTYSLTDRLYPDAAIRDTLINRNFSKGDTIAVALSHISPRYFQYLTTRERSGNSIFVTLLGEPVSYPSNVDGGYGMFNLHLPSIRLLILE